MSGISELSPVVVRTLLDIQDKGGSCRVPTWDENGTLRKHMKVAAKHGAGVLEVIDGQSVFRLSRKVSSPALCSCGGRLHITSSGASCPKCRNGIRELSRQERAAMKKLGATWSESAVDRLASRD